nr:DNA methyltransferase [uncultured Jannaschia sp.]
MRADDTTWRQRKDGLDAIYSQAKKLRRAHGDDFKASTQGLKDWFKGLDDGHPAKRHKHYSHIDRRGIYFPDNISWPGGGGPKYEVLHPDTRRPVKVPSRGWMTADPEKMQEWIADERVHFGETEDSVPCIKAYLADREDEVPYSVFYQDGRAASKRLRTLMDGTVFDFPKDEEVLQKVIEFVTDDGDMVMDFFAGSSSTAHAIIKQSVKDGEHRPFVMIQWPEDIDEKNPAYGEYPSIAALSRERIRRAGHKILTDHPDAKDSLDVGFRAFRIDDSNFHDTRLTVADAAAVATDDAKRADLLDGLTSHIKDGRTDEDLLFGALLAWGVDITLPVRRDRVEGRDVLLVDAPDDTAERAALIACFARDVDVNLAAALAALKPLRVVFRDDGFVDDATKENVASRFQQLAPDTTLRVL